MKNISSVPSFFIGKEIFSQMIEPLGDMDFVDISSINTVIAENFGSVTPAVYGVKSEIFYDSFEIYIKGYELVKPKFSDAQENLIADFFFSGGQINKMKLSKNQLKSFDALFSRYKIFEIDEDDLITFSPFFAENFLTENSDGTFSYIDEFQ